jgi:adenine phosphoribosyltransferase
MDLTRFIRDIPDFPKPGIVFKDITPLLNNAEAFKAAVEMFVERHRESNPPIDRVVGIESRGFIFATAVSYALGTGLVLVRKAGKLPHHTIGATYDLEYGTDTLEVHKDAIEPGESVLILDDLLATGGTLEATCRLVEQLGGEIAAIGTLIELTFLKGREKLGKRPYYSLIQF